MAATKSGSQVFPIGFKVPGRVRKYLDASERLVLQGGVDRLGRPGYSAELDGFPVVGEAADLQGALDDLEARLAQALRVTSEAKLKATLAAFDPARVPRPKKRPGPDKLR